MDKNANILQTVPLFKNLRPDELKKVAEAAVSRSVDTDSYLFMQGDPAESVYVVTGGRFQLVQVNPEGQQIILRYSVPGDAMSLTAVLNETVYPASALAVEPSKTLGWDRATMRHLIERHPAIAYNAIRILGQRVYEFQERVRELSTERVERRIARALIRLARQAGRKTEEGVVIDLPLSRQDLAEMTGTTLFTVSRTLSGWETRGLIQSKRERITIRFPHGLVQIAEDLPTPRPPVSGDEAV